MKQQFLEAIAYRAMQNAQAAGWTVESLLIDAAENALTAAGMPHDDAAALAQRVFNEHFRIMGAG